MIFEAILSMLAAVGYALLWRQHQRHVRLAARPWARYPIARYPSVTVIRPIKGLDSGLERNVEAAFEPGYPARVEMLFVFDTPEEPAVAVVEHVMAQRRSRGLAASARLLFSGEPPPGRTGKLNAMIRGYAEATGELVAFVDSDVRLDRDDLTVLVETLETHLGAGSTFAPVRVVAPPRTAGDAGYRLMLNALYGPHALEAADRKGGRMPFIMGQAMVVRREAIEAIGGLERADGQLVDDMYLGACIDQAGWENVMSPKHVEIVQAGLGMGEFRDLFLRWLLFSRNGLPVREFLGPWIKFGAFWAGLVVAAALAASGSWLVAWLYALAPVVLSLGLVDLHRAIGGARLGAGKAWVAFALFLLAPAAYTVVLAGRSVSWRGRSYRLDRQARLAEGSPAAGPECPEELRGSVAG